MARTTGKRKQRIAERDTGGWAPYDGREGPLRLDSAVLDVRPGHHAGMVGFGWVLRPATLAVELVVVLSYPFEGSAPKAWWAGVGKDEVQDYIVETTRGRTVLWLLRRLRELSVLGGSEGRGLPLRDALRSLIGTGG